MLPRIPTQISCRNTTIRISCQCSIFHRRLSTYVEHHYLFLDACIQTDQHRIQIAVVKERVAVWRPSSDMKIFHSLLGVDIGIWQSPQEEYQRL